ncbi:PREDICTED: ankyrin repeat-containing protein At2g01680 [Tarenaya hassleriana]|uniref:ankyrin repeat-containing protein At2g01680 n=1 Tax=Tarenaya hassleriana TaxID=28532 RepID=UPI00053C21B7|nr:PREDICTED: ankyrin repeat-containing protein At2g01680 [Tarenaya hassleriana]
MDIDDTLITVAEDESLNMAAQGEDHINERLKTAAQNGDIEKFYHLLDEDPNILERFDRDPFCETPLHIAVRSGQTHFAMEITSLKPSLAWKLNKSGFSPMHLALQSGCLRIVRGLMAIDKDLVRIRGRGRITPFHYVAQTGDSQLLGEFLLASPSSIEDLTIKCETAVHIAVKNHKSVAFKVLLGWLKRASQEEILNWKDEDGNTVFHIATSTNQTEVLKLLRKIVNVNAKNLEGETAMDIFQSNQASLSPEVGEILVSSKAKAAHKLSSSARNLAGYLSQGLSLMEKRNKLMGLNSFISNKQGSHDSSDLRSSVLVVAILIATATYQAGLSPPGGYWQEDNEDHFAGKMILRTQFAVIFYGLNGIAFFSSVSVILILIIGLPMWKVMYGATAALGIANFTSFLAIFQGSGSVGWYIALVVLLFSYPLVTALIVFVPFVAFLRNECSRRRVDSPTRYFSSCRELTW